MSKGKESLRLACSLVLVGLGPEGSVMSSHYSSSKESLPTDMIPELLLGWVRGESEDILADE